ncbi:hypothetical protein DFP93_11775 [Aneurinibacillus soli]|uniref:Uncharacterized protein n=1 Tax=Aneurinibacillus soli TaxID=1500254 RepID=A0A0U5B486_9BACL|nr:hypothetical protein DFP93_11775 [Aneurinibacillus soli]BAU29168.1 hypothetical protein CB4_03349 [Aneurinibacillus soli]
MRLASFLFADLLLPTCGGGAEKEVALSLCYALRGSEGCPLQEAGELAHKRGAKREIHRSIVGKSPFDSPLPLSILRKGVP